MVISTRYERSRTRSRRTGLYSATRRSAQIIGVLMNAIFLDTLDQDAIMMDRLNALVAELTQTKTQYELRPIKLLLLRPFAETSVS